MTDDFLLDFDDLDADQQEWLEESYETIKTNFESVSPGDIDLQIAQFDLFNANCFCALGGVLLIKHSPSICHLAYVKVQYFYRGAAPGLDAGFDSCKVWGVVKLKHDFGRVLIRRETFADKVLDLVQHVELHFKDDKAFSNKYHVVTNDNDRAMAAMSYNFRNLLMGIDDKDILLEIVNYTLVIGNTQQPTPQNVMFIADITAKIALLHL